MRKPPRRTGQWSTDEGHSNARACLPWDGGREAGRSMRFATPSASATVPQRHGAGPAAWPPHDPMARPTGAGVGHPCRSPDSAAAATMARRSEAGVSVQGRSLDGVRGRPVLPGRHANLRCHALGHARPLAWSGMTKTQRVTRNLVAPGQPFLAGGRTEPTVLIRGRGAGACAAAASRPCTGASHAARGFSFFLGPLEGVIRTLTALAGAKTIASVSFLRVAVRPDRRKKRHQNAASQTPIFTAAQERVCAFWWTTD